MIPMVNITTTFVRNIIKERPVDMHKGDAGRVLIIAGSKGMSGAAVLAARGALYSGAGLVKIALPEELFSILQITVPEAMCINRKELLTSASDVFNKYDAICIGPGLGVNSENAYLVERVLSEYSGPIVVDADAINCLCEFGTLKQVLACRPVFTPHPGEADRMLKSLGQKSCKELGREAAVKLLVNATNSVVLLKGAGTLIADGTEYCPNSGNKTIKIYKNPTGNPGMATGGSGDVLSGIITSLMAQKSLNATPLEAAAAGAFIHGLAGDIAAENIGEYGMTSTDIADAVSAAFRSILDISMHS